MDVDDGALRPLRRQSARRVQVAQRYEREGLSGLVDRSRAPRRQAAQTPPEIVAEIVTLRQQHPTWGPRKLRAWLDRSKPDTSWPACSTIGAIVKREGLTKPRRRRRRLAGAWKPPRTDPDQPNRVWTADFKGEFRLGCGRLCYPLTVLDAHSRYLLDCRALPGTGTAGARSTFERVFREFGLPDVIRTDNGVPFSTHATAGLSKLAVWWIRLGIRLERIRRRHPEDNGAHERMHRTLKAEATRPARRTPHSSSGRSTGSASCSTRSVRTRRSTCSRRPNSISPRTEPCRLVSHPSSIRMRTRHVGSTSTARSGGEARATSSARPYAARPWVSTSETTGGGTSTSDLHSSPSSTTVIASFEGSERSRSDGDSMSNRYLCARFNRLPICRSVSAAAVKRPLALREACEWWIDRAMRGQPPKGA